jgi:N-dimethylarginine dimethylaminohydrolase
MWVPRRTTRSGNGRVWSRSRTLPLRLADPRFYHLDTCLCPLRSDALAFACNAVEAGDAIVLHRASPTLHNRLHGAGYRVYETDLSDFHKSGGRAISTKLA